jgi:hypothetical protein
MHLLAYVQQVKRRLLYFGIYCKIMGWPADKELEKMLKEVVVTRSDTLSRLGVTAKPVGQNSRSPIWNLKEGFLEYVTGLLPSFDISLVRTVSNDSGST